MATTRGLRSHQGVIAGETSRSSRLSQFKLLGKRSEGSSNVRRRQQRSGTPDGTTLCWRRSWHPRSEGWQHYLSTCIQPRTPGVGSAQKEAHGAVPYHERPCSTAADCGRFPQIGPASAESSESNVADREAGDVSGELRLVLNLTCSVGCQWPRAAARPGIENRKFPLLVLTIINRAKHPRILLVTAIPANAYRCGWMARRFSWPTPYRR